MIELNLGIGDGDCEVVKFNSLTEMTDHIKTFYSMNRVWVATAECEQGEILITESIPLIIQAIHTNHFRLEDDDRGMFFLQEYESYESAYSIALCMKEGNMKCYDGWEELEVK